MKIDKEFGDRIRSLRKKLNITQNELSNLSGLTRQTITKYERGMSKPKYKNALKLAKVLNVDVSFIYSGAVLLQDQSRKTYKELILQYVNICDSGIFKEDIISSSNKKKLVLTTEDQDFIHFIMQIKSMLAIENSLSIETVNNAMKELLDSFEIAILNKKKH